MWLVVRGTFCNKLVGSQAECFVSCIVFCAFGFTFYTLLVSEQIFANRFNVALRVAHCELRIGSALPFGSRLNHYLSLATRHLSLVTHFTVTSILRVLASGALDIVRRRTPSAYEAVIFSGSTRSGSVTERAKCPISRSRRW